MTKLASGLAGRFAKTAFGAAVLTLAALSGASAQYYPPQGGPYGGPAPGYYRHSPPPGYRDGGYRRPRRVEMGTVCVTSRGSCQQRRYAPIGAGCGCIIPGFGKKRGNIEY